VWACSQLLPGVASVQGRAERAKRIPPDTDRLIWRVKMRACPCHEIFFQSWLPNWGAYPCPAACGGNRYAPAAVQRRPRVGASRSDLRPTLKSDEAYFWAHPTLEWVNVWHADPGLRPPGGGLTGAIALRSIVPCRRPTKTGVVCLRHRLEKPQASPNAFFRRIAPFHFTSFAAV